MPVHYFDPNGVESLRENGYRDTAMALAELIDNSIQADASKIDIILVERRSTEWLVEDIIVVDNGHGMDKETLETSLRFGGGTRHGAKKGLGKFGMGLPNSSASQAPRFEVYSWLNKRNIFYNYFDFEEIKNKKSEFLPDVENVELDIPSNIFTLYNTGTIVRWIKCDRLILRRANRLVPHIIEPLGRIFRYYLDSRKVEITIKVFQDNGEQLSERKELYSVVKPIDPLFLMIDTQLPSPFDHEATSEIFGDDLVCFPDPKKDKELYKKIGGQVKLRFSVAKPKVQLPSTSGGIGGGNSEIGQFYRKMLGISVVRAGREIKLDEFKFITDVSDPTNRWWKVELQFEPEFDEYFGLDNTKQNVHAFKYISEDQKDNNLYEDDLVYWFQCELSEFIKNQINEMHKRVKANSAGTRGGPRGEGGDDNNSNLPPGPFPESLRPVPQPTTPEEEIKEEPTNQEREEAKAWLLNRYPYYKDEDEKLKLALDWFFSNSNKQFIVFLQLGDNELYSYKPITGKTIIEINTNHDFYQRFIRDIFETGDYDKIDPLLLLFGSMVEAEKELPSYQKHISRFRGQFALKLNHYLLDWEENK